MYALYLLINEAHLSKRCAIAYANYVTLNDWGKWIKGSRQKAQPWSDLDEYKPEINNASKK